jgi:hypothetical protein
MLKVTQVKRLDISERMTKWQFDSSTTNSKFFHNTSNLKLDEGDTPCSSSSSELKVYQRQFCHISLSISLIKD